MSRWGALNAPTGSRRRVVCTRTWPQFGDYVERNVPAALAHAQRASDLGSSLALLLLGFMHSIGEGVPRDEAKVGDNGGKPAADGCA